MKNFTSFFFLFLISFSGYAQYQKYWIYFHDKDIENYDFRVHLSTNAIQNRSFRGIPLIQESDIPLKPNYISTLKKYKIEPIVQSKWLNAVSAFLSDTDIEQIKNLPFIKKISLLKGALKVCNASPYLLEETAFDKTISQMEADFFKKNNLNGKGIAIGVIDAGFYKADEEKLLEHLFKEERVMEVIDFVTPSKNKHFSVKETGLDGHGTQVLERITGNSKLVQMGLATASKFYLARTDHGNKEWRGEEDNWIKAMERMDSLGVRLINTSLGYALGFDEPSENYSPKEMDGQTSTIAKACKMATEEKGMFIVVSAGNEGNVQGWKIVSTPGDVKGVVSVGSTNSNGMKMGYSSIGPDFLPYLKPNVSCFALGGTSFAAPAVTGFVACLMQHKPKATNQELFDALEKSAHLYPYGNNYLGYGIPKASKAIQILDREKVSPDVEVIEAFSGSDVTFKLEKNQTGPIIIFHKSDKTNVLEQEKIEKIRETVLIKRPKKVQRSTIVLANKIVEVLWAE